jgi:hypothetical protein
MLVTIRKYQLRLIPHLDREKMAMFADITSNKLYEVFFKSELAE